ncbi:MAG: hypothetical protein O7A04_06775 [Acidobacteria bacterium]|nr:hypothetical protein [Acidobacteriota bacterium]
MSTSRGDGSVTKAYPSRRDGQGKPICSYCGKPLAGRARRYCSDACKVETYVRAGVTAEIRHQLTKRDAEICAVCDLDCRQLESDLYSLESGAWSWNEDVTELNAVARAIQKRGNRRLVQLGFNEGISLWQAAHVLAVVEGGGECGIEGYITLCVPCHKRDTAELARRMAVARDPQLELFG